MNRSEIGSQTALGGFMNEHDVCKKFAEYQSDADSQQWLSIMGYDYSKIQKIEAQQIPVRINKEKAIDLGVTEQNYELTIRHKKADIQIRILIIIDDILYVEDISLKKANIGAGFNQVDKRPVSTYKQMWNFSSSVEKNLKLFTGELDPATVLDKTQIKGLKNNRRLFLTDMNQDSVSEIVSFFTENKTIVVADILRGRGSLSAEWFLVTKKNENDTLSWILKDINYVCNFYSKGEVKISPRGSLKIGRVTMQRKGGTPDPTSLQFKINPLDLFNE